MRNTLLFEAIKEKPAIAVLCAIGIFFVTPLIQLMTTPLAFEIWSTDILQKPASSIPYIALAILFGMFITLHFYTKNKCIDCKKNVKAGVGGSAFGFMIGVCPACFSFIGFLLPLGGSIFLTIYSPIFLAVAIGIILFSIYKMGGFKDYSKINSNINQYKNVNE